MGRFEINMCIYTEIEFKYLQLRFYAYFSFINRFRQYDGLFDEYSEVK